MLIASILIPAHNDNNQASTPGISAHETALFDLPRETAVACLTVDMHSTVHSQTLFSAFYQHWCISRSLRAEAEMLRLKMAEQFGSQL